MTRARAGLGRGGKALAVLASLVVVAAGAKFAAPVLVPLLVAACIAAATAPIADWLCARGLPGYVAVTMVIFGVLGFLAGFGFIVAQGAQDVAASLPTYTDELAANQQAIGAWLTKEGMSRAANAVMRFDPREAVGDAMTAGVLWAPSFISSFAVVLLVVIFVLLESATFRTKLRRISERGGDNLAHLEETVREVQKYLLVKTVMNAVTGVLVASIAAAFRIDHPVFWGLLAFVLNYVPSVGSTIAALPIIALAFVQHGLAVGVTVLIVYVGVNFTLGNFVEPRVFGRALGLSPLVVLVSMFVWGWILGPVGAVLSAPITVAIKIAMARSDELQWVAIMLAPSDAKAESEELERISRTSLAPKPD